MTLAPLRKPVVQRGKFTIIRREGRRPQRNWPTASDKFASMVALARTNGGRLYRVARGIWSIPSWNPDCSIPCFSRFAVWQAKDAGIFRDVPPTDYYNCVVEVELVNQ